MFRNLVLPSYQKSQLLTLIKVQPMQLFPLDLCLHCLRQSTSFPGLVNHPIWAGYMFNVSLHQEMILLQHHTYGVLYWEYGTQLSRKFWLCQKPQFLTNARPTVGRIGCWSYKNFYSMGIPCYVTRQKKSVLTCMTFYVTTRSFYSAIYRSSYSD
jgi:hypothetical protein